MKIKFYGVRGSLPTPSRPGFETSKYGGNTTCLEAILDSGEEYIFDMGSGLAVLGDDLMSKGFGQGQGKAKIFLSHVHWDHIQGFPFFTPAYIGGNQLDLYGEAKAEKTLEETMAGQQEFPNFPVTLAQMRTYGAELNFHDLKEGESIENGAKISYMKVDHPDSCFSYKIEEKKQTFVFCTDNEHDGSYNDGKYEFGENDKRIVEWSKDADAMYYDAQYTPEEYDPSAFDLPGMSKKTWGHSTYEVGIDIALEAGVKRLFLGHHDIRHSDDTMDAITKRAQDYLDEKFSEGDYLVKPSVQFAKEGEEIDLEPVYFSV
jgi:ribonuclease BN (tRNA processing enzyme)